MSSNTENKNFEDSLLELEDIVEKLENGQISLQESMEMFERGINLQASAITFCKKLNNA